MPLRLSRLRRLARRRAWVRLANQVAQRWGRNEPYLLIACMPKSGSTFLRVALMELTGYRRARLTYGVERSEQELYLPALRAARRFPSVTQQHLKANRPNLELMRDFGIRPVVLVRNLCDVVISIRDHLYNEGFERFQTFYANERFSELDEKAQLDAIIELGLPWYVHFYVSWVDAVAKGRTEALWLSYEQARSNWTAALRRVSDFYGLGKSDAEVEQAVARAQASRTSTRLNRGLAGRGQAILSADQQRRIVELTRFYPWVDFTPIGIPPDARGNLP